MARHSLVSLLLVACALLALTVSVPVARAADEDPVAIVDAQLAAVPPVTAQCAPSAALVWLDRVGEIFSRIASGGLPALPPSATGAVQTLSSQVLASATLSADARVLAKTAELLPSLWAAGFFYATPETWKPVLSAVTTPLAALCKPNEASYQALVNATALAVRFTKDNVFLDGVDRGDAIPNAAHRGFVRWLAQLVAGTAKREGFTLTEAQLRAYMNTLPSKRDGMDMTVAFPVYVDTAKYKASDAAALRRFLTKSIQQTTAAAQ